MKKNDYVKLNNDVTGLQGTIPAGTIFQVLRMNPAKTLVNLQQIEGMESIQIAPSEVTLVSKSEVDIAAIDTSIAKYKARIAKEQAEWDVAPDMSLTGAPRDNWSGGNVRWYWGWENNYNDRKWIERARPTVSESWVAEQKQAQERIKKADQALEYRRWDGQKIWFKANADGMDMKRIAETFKDDLPKGVQFAAQAKVWW